MRDTWRHEVRPRLTADALFPASAIRERRGAHWRGACPFHGDDDARSRRFSVHVATLGWRCFSCGQHGGPLDMLMGGSAAGREADAIAAAAALVGVTLPTRPVGAIGQARRSTRTPTIALRASPGRVSGAKPALGARQGPDGPKPRERAQNGATALETARDHHSLPDTRTADGTPAAAYLVGRLVWPPDAILPRDVRWLDRASVPGKVGRLPAAAVGCVTFRFRDSEGAASAAKLEALDADGKRLEPRWRRNWNRTNGLRFRACDLPGGSLHVCEGEVTALALAVQCLARGRGAAVAVGGSSGLRAGRCWDPDARPVSIHADRDRAGRAAARQLRRELRAAGRACTALDVDTAARGPCANPACQAAACQGCDGLDAADALAGAVGERAAIGATEGGLDAADALAAAWAFVRRELTEARWTL